jgi:signal transduction histidine kinase
VTDSLPQDLADIGRMKAIPVLLDTICRSTGMGFAAVVQVVQGVQAAPVTETRWIAAALRDDIGFGVKPGDALPIETPIRNEIRDGREIVVIEDVAADPRFRRHPAPALYGFKSYISVPILRENGEFFGTLCALDRAPHVLKQPETIAMFETFAAMIGAHLSAIDREALTEASLLNERKTSALREQFIAVLGHDLRNPLTAILGGMEMLRKNPLNERATQWAEMVVASAERMAQLIDVVMDFSRSRLGGGLAIEYAPCDSVEPALLKLLAELRTAKPGRVFKSRFAMTGPVQCDLRRILQLASSLLGNAVNYGDPRRPILLEAATPDGWFELAVTNAGEPIPDHLLEIIFEPFSRGALQPNREGLGLGLYISHQIAQAHHGTLTVVSSAEETRFTFRMPLRQPEI